MTDAHCPKINVNATKGQIHTGMKLLLQVADALSRRGLSANAGHVMIVAIAPLVTEAMYTLPGAQDLQAAVDRIAWTE